MRARTIIICWVALLIPTLAAGAGALILLDRERDRLNQAEIEAGRHRAAAMAEHIAATFVDVQNGLRRSLLALPADDRTAELTRWSRENPLVRHGFVWDPARGLRLPEAASHPSDAERLFVLRYESLFSGRRPWPQPDVERPKPDGPQSTSRSGAGRRALAELAMPKSARDNAVGTRTGWLPWFAGERLHLLGWARLPGESVVFGIELELMAVLSRLLPTLSRQAGPGVILALEDGHGHVVHRTDGPPLGPAAQPVGRVLLAPVLPHWQVAVYRLAPEGVPAGRRAFWLVSLLVVGAVVAAIAFGGGLIAWQAIHHLQDAQAKTNFVSNVSHELKTPLTSIRMYAELLADGRATTAESQQRYLTVIQDESRRLTRLVNNVLDFGRLEQGRRTFRAEMLDVNQWLSGFVQTHRLRLEEAKMAVSLTLPNATVTARVDRDALEQAVLNLVDNAVKYAADSGRLQIELTAAMAPVIRVVDGGPGIRRGDAERIFEKFVRLDESLTARQSGSGLGLTIARGLMRGQDGDVRWVAGASGGGWFEVMLPAASLKGNADVES